MENIANFIEKDSTQQPREAAPDSYVPSWQKANKHSEEDSENEDLEDNDSEEEEYEEDEEEEDDDDQGAPHQHIDVISPAKGKRSAAIRNLKSQLEQSDGRGTTQMRQQLASPEKARPTGK